MWHFQFKNIYASVWKGIGVKMDNGLRRCGGFRRSIDVCRYYQREKKTTTTTRGDYDDLLFYFFFQKV